jgi:hypothetical protein
MAGGSETTRKGRGFLVCYSIGSDTIRARTLAHESRQRHLSRFLFSERYLKKRAKLVVVYEDGFVMLRAGSLVQRSMPKPGEETPSPSWLGRT